VLLVDGPMDTRGHPFFEPLGENGRACVTCHQPSDAMSLSPEALEPKLRGVELQLPRSGLWVGYDWSEEGETPRATFSIQREF